jgi:pimeloyl-ACP methyl ester carboxylesterase
MSDRAQGIAAVNGIEIWYETFGDPADPPLLLVMGLGGQAIAWADELCRGFVDRGFFVIRYDNRDVGLSTHLEGKPDPLAAMQARSEGRPVDAPYSLDDLAADAVGLLDHLGIPAAHVVGASMGGMIAQLVAIEHPERVLTLTSVMSTTGEDDVGQPDPSVLPVLLQPVPEGREGAIEQALRVSAAVGSPEHRDEERIREHAGAAYDRAFDPDGVARQLLATMASPDRAEGLKTVVAPTLVIHGSADKLIDPSGGRRTAELVPGAQFELVEGMGHDLPVFYWSPVIELITRHAANAAAG